MKGIPLKSDFAFHGMSCFIWLFTEAIKQYCVLFIIECIDELVLQLIGPGKADSNMH